MHAIQHAVTRVACGRRAQLLRGAAPQQKHRGGVPSGQGIDHCVGKHLPAQLAVTVGAVFFHRQHAIQQQHPLLCPMAECAVGWQWHAQIAVQFLEDIAQRGRCFYPR